ncbi:MAG: response regulator [Desulfobacca sp.]|uniref:response regulator n=1 Tax=Desulfobacca sp. TaxID=2067990 RepID=UPI00404A7FF9
MALRQSQQDRTKVILLIEDDRQILALTQELLEHLGFQVVTAASGDQALALLQQWQQEIDLVIMDLNLPSVDGYQLLHRLQRLTPAIKIIVTSGFFGQEEEGRLKAAGAAATLAKPFRTQQLQAAITRALTG